MGTMIGRATPERTAYARGARVGMLGLLVLAVVAALDGGTARGADPDGAHGLHGAPSLYVLTHDADAIVRATVVAADPTGASPVVHLDVVEVLKGPVTPGPLAFTATAPLPPVYLRGEEVVVFLAAAPSPPPEAPPTTVTTPWISSQPAETQIVLTPVSRVAFLSAVRAYATVATRTEPAERLAALQRATVTQLVSGEERLALSALQDLERAPELPLVTASDMPVLAPMIHDPRAPITVRVALLDQLARRRLAFAPWHWSRLLRKSRGADRLAVIEALATHPSVGTNRELGRIIERTADPALAAAATRALGAAGNHRAVETLTHALGDRRAVVRDAALEALLRIGTQSARATLELAALYHPDAGLRHRAGAAAVILARRQGTTLAPSVAMPETTLAPRGGAREPDTDELAADDTRR